MWIKADAKKNNTLSLSICRLKVIFPDTRIPSPPREGGLLISDPENKRTLSTHTLTHIQPIFAWYTVVYIYMCVLLFLILVFLPLLGRGVIDLREDPPKTKRRLLSDGSARTALLCYKARFQNRMGNIRRQREIPDFRMIRREGMRDFGAVL